MKYVKSFDQYLTEKALNEAAGDKEASKILLKVADGLSKELKKEKDPDLIKAYTGDVKDYKLISDIAKDDIKKASKKWSNLDTVSRDCIVDYLSKKDAKALADAFGVEINENNEIVIVVSVVEKLTNRKEQIEFIITNADDAGYPDLKNREFIESLTDLGVTNFYLMMLTILTYNDSRVSKPVEKTFTK